MLPPAFSNSADSLEAQDYEQLIQDSIIAIKNGNRSQGKRLLEQAALINDTDPRIWIWLSATTEDLQERRSYLEHAVALDPANATAKRGLLMLTDKLDKARLMSDDASKLTEQAIPPETASTKTYVCANCGATISYNPLDGKLVCQYCGFTRKVDESMAGKSSDQLLDASLPTAPAHQWAESQTRVTCEQCGVTILLPAGQTADSCPYCASNRFITSPSLMEMIDPQVIGVFKVDPKKAGENVRAWLGKGLFVPDDLVSRHAGMQLHPAYYPFWLFEGTLEIPWFCDVNVGTSKLPEWEAKTGTHFEMFKDLLIPGLRTMTMIDLTGIEPFNLKELTGFSPDFLAGWVALTYDQPLADASLRAREKVVKKVQPSLASLVEPNKTKRNFSIGAGKWSGLTYKLALLPIYVGNYPFQGTRYRLFINGQTGKVHGKKPVDMLKVVMLSIAGLIILAIIYILITLFWKRITG